VPDADTAAAAAADSASRPKRTTLSTLRYDLRAAIPEPAKQLLALFKGELSLVVTISSAYGYFLAGDLNWSWIGLACTFSGTIALAFAAAVGNQIREVPFDRMMPRTQRRPLVTGYFTVPQAYAMQAALIGTGVPLLLIAAQGHPLAATLGLATGALYTLVYTPVKRMHRWNTELGAVVGAIPVLVGWSCAVPSWNAHMLSAGALAEPVGVLASMGCWHALAGFFFLYAWQMQHFMTIAFKEQASYARAGYHMMAGSAAVKKGLAWVGLLCLFPVACYATGVTSFMFVISGSLANAMVVLPYLAWYRALHSPLSAGGGIGGVATQRWAKKTLGLGVLYFLVFVALTLFHVVAQPPSMVHNLVPVQWRRWAMAVCTHKSQHMREEIERLKQVEAEEAEAKRRVHQQQLKAIAATKLPAEAAATTATAAPTPAAGPLSLPKP